MGRRPRARVGVAGLAVATAGGFSVVLVSSVGSEGGADRPLAALYREVAVPLTNAQADAGERMNTLTERNPTTFAGAWRDPVSGQMLAGVVAAASPFDRALAQEAVAGEGSVVEVRRSFADLGAIRDDISDELDMTIAGVSVNSVGPDVRINAVVVGLERLDDEARAFLAERYGDAVVVSQQAEFRDN